LQSAKDQIQNKFGIEAATKSFREILSNQFIVDYADIVNPDTFELATENDTKLMALFAGKIGTTRLIDNLIIS
jgi:pantothenate synthetase